MRISDVLRHKGSAVTTVDPSTSVRELIGVLYGRRIGAVVVTEFGHVVGIASERDVVRELHERGPELLDANSADIMTRVVLTCHLQDSVDTLAELMTVRRIRHVPVVEDGRLAGIVSIGDVVKSRITELEIDRSQLASYIEQGLT